MAPGRRPGWYSWIAVILGCLVSMSVSVTVSVQASDRALERDQAQREQQRQESQRAVCTVVNGMRTAHIRAGSDPAIIQAWATMALVFHCN